MNKFFASFFILNSFSNFAFANDLKQNLYRSNELAKVLSGSIKFAIFKEDNSNPNWNTVRSCLISVFNNKNYLTERLHKSMNLKNTSFLNEIKELDDYLKSSDGNVFFKAFDASILMQSNNDTKNEAIQNFQNLSKLANMSERTKTNLNNFLYAISTTKTIEITEKYLKMGNKPCQSITFTHN